ncbi:branched-chain amino acid ABC transporter permease [Bosea vaviloviae]|uniref:branched-chain amino acid ABC transporter permease n=1 Tax=Bosea vaviloviae TaxID=1526658 RepID=UPI0006BAADFD|nr:branched-chain amino acid ABC transporter permease [Bosea vaviloviae]
MRHLLPSILLVLALASCGERFDTDQMRLCRQAIPALNPPGAAIAIDRVQDGARPHMLGISYSVSTPGGVARRRRIDCLFAGEGQALTRGALIGIAADGRPMSDASFYLLRRFYLENREEPPPDPGASPSEALPEIAPALAYGLQQGLSALPSAATYALLACAYALIYGLTGRIVLSFGEFAALGALSAVVGAALLVAYAASTPATGLVAAFIVAILVCALHGFAMGRFVLRPLESRFHDDTLGRQAPGQQVLIATIGLAIALSEYLRLAQGANLRWLPPVFNEPLALARAGSFIVTVTPLGLAVAAAGFAVTLGLILLIARSAYGRAWRAVSDDARTAALFGVDPRAVHDKALILACAASGMAGVVVTAVYGGMGFAGGFSLGLKALVGSILGGIGSPAGAALGGLCIALFEVLWSSTMPIDNRDIAVYSLLAVVLILRPGGFFGDGALAPRQV